MVMRFTLWLRALVSLLSVQFLLGIWVNLYGSVPDSNSLVAAFRYTGDPVLSAHMLLAVVLVVLAFVITVGAFDPAAPPRLRWLALAGLVTLFGAYEAGIQFIMSGYSSNLDSFLMALAFIVAMVFYGVAQTVVGPSGPSADRGRHERADA